MRESRVLRLVLAGVAGLLVLACGSSTSEEPSPAAEATLDEAPEPPEAAQPAEPAEPSAQVEAIAPESAPDHLARLAEQADWARLAAPSSEHAIARTEVVKVLLDYASDRLYFMQSARWPVHYDFARRFLATEERPLDDRAAFNRAYTRADRPMQMASLVRYRDADVWALELGPADNVGTDRLTEFFERVKGAVFFGDALRYRPRSPMQIRRARGASARLPLADLEGLWSGVRYQPVTLGQAVGRLRMVEGPLEPERVSSGDVLVLAEVPLDLPVCAAVVTAELQAPLAHVAVLSQARGTPNMALRGAMTEEAVVALDGELVRLTVGRGGYTLEAATEEMRETFEAVRRPDPVQLPSVDRSRRELADLSELALGDTGWAGAKAAQLGEASRVEGVVTAGGFVVPIARSLEHIERAEIDVGVVQRASGYGRGALRARLEDVREQITQAPVAPELLSAMRARMRSGGTWILRSSTNAEDLAGFTGAGLYESVVIRSTSEVEVADAIRAVWASVWSSRAHSEYLWYGVEHEDVGMAVLVQPFVAEPIAFGVAITENPFSTQRSGILVNLAPEGSSVTGAQGEELPEQVLLYRHSRAEILSRSTHNGGQPLLAEGRTRALRGLLDSLHEHFLPLWGQGVDAADIELALTEDRFVILQVRPYRLRSPR